MVILGYNMVLQGGNDHLGVNEMGTFFKEKERMKSFVTLLSRIVIDKLFKKI